MSFYNSVHYCQGNAGILDLYSTLSVSVCEFVYVCVCLRVCVVVPNFHITSAFSLFLALANKHHVVVFPQVFIYPLTRPSIHPLIHSSSL